MKSLILLILIILLFCKAKLEMTEKQFESAIKLIHDVCQKKNKLTNEQIGALHNGEFPADVSVTCYTECVLRMANMFKNGQVTYDAALAQIGALPASTQEKTKEMIEKFKDFAPKSNDKCESAYELYQYIYNLSPSEFILP